MEGSGHDEATGENDEPKDLGDDTAGVGQQVEQATAETADDPARL